MMRRWPAAIVSLLVLFWDGAAAQAQYYGGYLRQTGQFSGFQGGRAGSTAAGSFLAGQTALTAAAGQHNLNTSRAANNYQQAYRSWIDNQRNRTATYFEMRRMNASYRAESRRPPPTAEELMSLNQQRTPERLGPDQIDPISGKLL